jgi:hypothetical protein
VKSEQAFENYGNCSSRCSLLSFIILSVLFMFPGLESREYCRRDPSSWLRDTLYPQQLSLTSRTSGDRSVGILRSRNLATEFFFYLCAYFDRFEVLTVVNINIVGLVYLKDGSSMFFRGIGEHLQIYTRITSKKIAPFILAVILA